MASTCSGHWSISVTSRPALVSIPPTTQPIAPAPMIPIRMSGLPAEAESTTAPEWVGRPGGPRPVLLEAGALLGKSFHRAAPAPPDGIGRTTRDPEPQVKDGITSAR